MKTRSTRRLVGSSNARVTLVPDAVQESADFYSAGRTSDVLAMLSHEMLNAIAPMANALQILRLTEGSAVPHKALTLMDRQLTHLSHLVGDLQEISTVGSGRMRFRPGRFDLREVVPRSVEAVMSSFAHRRQEVFVTLPAEPIWLDADPIRIEQVVVNLVSNAAKYTQDEGRIQVVARRAQDQAELLVSDNGMGIAAEMIPRIFDLYMRVETANGHSRNGLGIGLNVVRRIVDLHGGNVVARSAGPGAGSEFVVSLPVASPTM